MGPALPDASPDIRSYQDGLRQARAFVLAAPVMIHPDKRDIRARGGVPRVLDFPAPDGDPNLVYNTYALRDAILNWIDRALADV